MKFEEFLIEAGKRFAYSKDGVRKHVKTDREAEEWKQTIAKTPKPAKKDHLPEIARIIETEVGNHFPDSDGMDVINSKVRKLTGIKDPYEATLIIDKAAKKHLRVKDFHTYVDDMHKQYAKDNP